MADQLTAEEFNALESHERPSPLTYEEMGADPRKPVAEEEAEPYESTEAAADALRARRQATEPETIERTYSHIGGEKHGQAMEPHFALSRERATEDLADERAAEATAIADQQTEAVRAEQDALRSQQTPEQQTPPVEQQPQPQQQQEQQQYAEQGIDPEITQALQNNPKLLAAIHQQNQQTAAAVQQYEAQVTQLAQTAIQQARQQTAVNGKTAVLSILADFPELSQVPAEHLQTAINMIAKSNPEKAQQIETKFARVRALSEQVARDEQAVQQYAQAQHAKQWQQFAKAHDDYFDHANRDVPQEQMKEIRAEAVNMLRESGMSDEAIKREYNSNALLRSYQGQQILADAARYRLAKRGVSANLKNPVPTLQRPGTVVSEGRLTDVAAAERRFSAKHDVRSAAAVLSARRATRR
jgi:predicted transposase YbfD/YdcC